MKHTLNLLGVISLAAGLTLSGCNPQKSHSKKWLKLANEFALCIVDDPVDRSDAQFIVLDAALAAEEEKLALEITEKITDWTVIEARITLAEYYHKKQNEQKRDRQIAHAIEYVDKVSDWRHSRVILQLHQANAMLKLQQLDDFLADKLNQINQIDDSFDMLFHEAKQKFQDGEVHQALDTLRSLHPGVARIYPRKWAFFLAYKELVQNNKTDSARLQWIDDNFNDFKGHLTTFDTYMLHKDYMHWLVDQNQSENLGETLDTIIQEFAKLQSGPLAKVIYYLALAEGYVYAAELDKASQSALAAHDLLLEPDAFTDFEEKFGFRSQLASVWYSLNDEKRYGEELKRIMADIKSYRSLRIQSFQAASLCADISKREYRWFDHTPLYNELIDLKLALLEEASKREFKKSKSD